MSIHQKVKPKRVSSRRVFKPSAAARRKHATRVGDVIISWNDLQVAFLFLFAMVINNGSDVNLAVKIWMTIKSDSGQRDVLRATIEANLGHYREAQKRALWALTVADKLSAIRNDFTHVAIGYNTANPKSWAAVPMALAIPRSRIERLSAADLGKIQRVLCGDLRQVTAMVTMLAYHIAVPLLAQQAQKEHSQQPLPKIPRLKIHSVYPKMKSELRYLPTTKGPRTRQKAHRS